MQRDALTRSAISLALATGVYAVSYGVLAVAAGLSVAQTCVLSLLTFTGASQFTYVSVLSGGGGAGAALAPALVLAARNGVYGLSLRSVMSTPPAPRWRRLLRTQLVIDESTAMAHAQAEPAQQRRAFDLTGTAIYVTWNLGTLAGALAGSGLGDPRDLGLDAMFPAVFLALLVPQLRRPGARPAAVAGALVAVVLLPFAPTGVPVLASALICLPILAASVRRTEAP